MDNTILFFKLVIVCAVIAAFFICSAMFVAWRIPKEDEPDDYEDH